MPRLKLTPDILAAAVMGFEVQKFAIEGKIAEIRRMMNGAGADSEPATPSELRQPRKKRSAAVRRKMALAQRARYAKLKPGSEPTQAVAVKPKRKRSAAVRKRMAVAQRKRWAAIKTASVQQAAVEKQPSARRFVQKQAALASTKTSKMTRQARDRKRVVRASEEGKTRAAGQ
jgi:hypothetical protein